MTLLPRLRRPSLLIAGTLVAAAAAFGPPTNPPPPAAAPPLGIWGLFLQSFDVFTIVLLTGSVTAGAYIFRAFVEIRPGAILPGRQTRTMTDLVREGRIAELKGFVQQDQSFVAIVLRAA